MKNLKLEMKIRKIKTEINFLGVKLEYKNEKWQKPFSKTK